MALFGLHLFTTCFDFRSPFFNVQESSKSASEISSGEVRSNLCWGTVSAACQTLRSDVWSSLSGSVGHFISSILWSLVAGLVFAAVGKACLSLCCLFVCLQDEYWYCYRTNITCAVITKQTSHVAQEGTDNQVRYCLPSVPAKCPVRTSAR